MTVVNLKPEYTPKMSFNVIDVVVVVVVILPLETDSTY